MFGELFDEVREKLKKDEIIFVRGSIEDDEFTGGKKMRATEVLTLEEVRARKVSKLKLEIDTCNLCDGFVDELAGLLQPYRPRDAGGCRVAVKIVNEVSQGDVILGDDWRVIPHDDLLQNLKEHYGSEKVHLQYA